MSIHTLPMAQTRRYTYFSHIARQHRCKKLSTEYEIVCSSSCIIGPLLGRFIFLEPHVKNLTFWFMRGSSVEPCSSDHLPSRTYSSPTAAACKLIDITALTTVHPTMHHLHDILISHEAPIKFPVVSTAFS